MKGLLRKLLSVQFILFLGFMCAFTTALGNLFEVFHSDHLSLSRPFDELDATLGNLEQLKSSTGYIGSKFLEDFDDLSTPTNFRGFEVVGGKKELDLFNHDKEALLTEAIYYLEKRFMVNGVLKDFEIFDTSNWPSGNDRTKVIAYGKEEISRILTHFNPMFRDVAEEIEEEWLRLKLFVTKRIPLKKECFTHYGVEYHRSTDLAP